MADLDWGRVKGVVTDARNKWDELNDALAPPERGAPAAPTPVKAPAPPPAPAPQDFKQVNEVLAQDPGGALVQRALAGGGDVAAALRGLDLRTRLRIIPLVQDSVAEVE